MPNATTIIGAIQIAYDNLERDSNAAQFRLAFEEFNNAWRSIFSALSPNERTVLDWLVPLRSVETNADTTADMGQLAAATEVLQRMLWATETAANESRITAAQEAAVLTAYNSFIARF